MRHILHALAALSALVAPGLALAGERTAVIEVSGLYCASCPYIAAQAINRVPSAEITGGVYDPAAELAQFVVRFDDTEATLDDIVSATEVFGYPARQIERVTMTPGNS